MDGFMRIYLDEMPIDLRCFGRGHTDGDIVIHLPDRRMLIAGDLFALFEPYRAVFDYSAGGSLRDWTRTLESEFDWGGLEMRVGLDGVINEMQ